MLVCRVGEMYYLCQGGYGMFGNGSWGLILSWCELELEIISLGSWSCALVWGCSSFLFKDFFFFFFLEMGASLCLQKECFFFLVNTKSSTLICRLLCKLTVPIVHGKGGGTEPSPAFDLCRSDVWAVIIKRV